MWDSDPIVYSVRGHRKNEANYFNNKIFNVCVKYSNTYPGRSYTNFAADGVSVDSKCVWTSLCKFLDGKKPYLGVTYTNHNVNYFCYEVVGGSSLVFNGNSIIDANLLHVTSIPHKLYRI